MTDREALQQLIKDRAVVHGKVILSSGREADYYVDLRRVTLDAEAAPADRPGHARPGRRPAHRRGRRSHARRRPGRAPRCCTRPRLPVRKLDAFVVRKEGKAHGLQRRIEGPDVAGKRVLAVEDTSTTGGSVLTAVEALREAGAEVVAVAVIVERGAAPTPSLPPGCRTTPRTRCPTWASAEPSPLVTALPPIG